MSGTIRSKEVPEGFTEILRSTVGSELHGMNIEGSDDHDEMGVCLEPPEYVIGLKHFEQLQWRSKPEGVRSQPGDTDRVIYSLRKYVRLALGGNPSVILLLFAPDDMLLVQAPDGADLRSMAPLILSKRAVARAFGGYMTQQRIRLERSIEQGNSKGHHIPSRPELIERYGWDTKYGAHVIRLGMQGQQLLSEGHLCLPMSVPEQAYLRSIRSGGVPSSEVLAEADRLLGQIHELEKTSTALPEQPNTEVIQHWMMGCYLSAWDQGGYIL